MSNPAPTAEPTEEPIRCRHCRKALVGKPGYMSGVYIPGSRDRFGGLIAAPWNYYGGYVCSEDCDRNVLYEMESSFPGAGRAHSLTNDAARRLRNNWSQA